MKKREKGTCAVRRNRAQMDGNGGTWGSGSQRRQVEGRILSQQKLPEVEFIFMGQDLL